MERKRLSADNAHVSKRARCQTSQQLFETYSHIDSIPTRSRPKPPIADASLAVKERARPTVMPQVGSSSGLNLSFASSTTSSKNVSFSKSHNSSFASSKNTSFSTDNTTSPDESCSEYFSSQEWATDSDQEPETTPSPDVLEKSLKCVFPKFGNGNFNHAPLAVVWEITRFALHCGVKLDEIDIPHGDPRLWDSQSTFRQFLSQQEAFKNKILPERTSDEAWDIALKSFQSQNGAILLSGVLVPNQDAKGPSFRLRLDPLRVASGHRLSRRFGSDRFLELSMPSISSLEKPTQCTAGSIARWLNEGPHYFLGRQWFAFYIKEDKAKNKKSKKAQKARDKRNKKTGQYTSWYKYNFFACDGDSFRRSIDASLPPHEDAVILKRRVKVVLHDLISWVIGDLSITQQQVIKFFSRIRLSLTDTTATVVLEKHQIYHCPQDIGKFPMNDGIGRMSGSLARKIASCLRLESIPCAFQARFGSAKGVWIVDDTYRPPSIGDEDWIVTYPSQRKWDCSYEDAQHRTFEVHSWPMEVKSASLNQQFIPLLEAQAIHPASMREIFARYLQIGLEEGLDELKSAMNDPLDLRHWLQRSSGSMSETSLRDNQQPFLGSLPRRTEDAAAALLDAGFNPKDCLYLQRMCWQLGNQMAKTLQDKMNIQVPCSAYLLMVVDFSSTLLEDEVQVSFSTKFQVEGFCDTLLEGMDILVARAPAHLPTDIQKVKVVSHKRLRHLKDVIVFSTRGETPLADKLSGGDYDGDKAWVCWDQNIVQNFRNAPPPPQDMKPLNLAKYDLTMDQVRKEERNPLDVCARLISEGIKFNIQPSLLGICTNFKEVYCRSEKSVSSPGIIALSRLLGFLVDQSKQGFMFTGEDWSNFRKDWGLHMSLSREKQKEAYVLDYLKDVAQSTVKKTLKDFQDSLDKTAQWYDADLTYKFNQYNKQHEFDPDWVKLRNKLRQDIDSLVDEWRSRRRPEDDTFVDDVIECHELWQKIQPPDELASSKLIQALLRDGVENPHSRTWELLKASFEMTRQQHSGSKFIWHMAGWQLCRLKQDKSSLRYAVVTPQLYSAMQLNKKVVARRRAHRLGGEEALQSEDDMTDD